MKLKVGQTLESVVDGTALIVVRSPEGDVTVTCGGREMVPKGDAAQRVSAVVEAQGPGTQLGKRYVAGGLDLELLCVKAGEHAVAVNGVEVSSKTARPLPASD